MRKGTAIAALVTVVVLSVGAAAAFRRDSGSPSLPTALSSSRLSA